MPLPRTSRHSTSTSGRYFNSTANTPVITAKDSTRPSTCIITSGIGNMPATNLPAAAMAELTVKETRSRNPQPRTTPRAADRCLMISLIPPVSTGRFQIALTEDLIRLQPNLLRKPA